MTDNQPHPPKQSQLSTGAGRERSSGPAITSPDAVDLVVVSGHSGAGKTSAMNVFEDAGFFCVDNLPPGMIRSLAELSHHEGSKIRRACVVTDVRGGDLFEGLQDVLDQLEREGVPFRVLFLTADEQTLINRYKETRRRHPLSPHASALDGIRAETRMLQAVADRADVVIDSTGLSANALRRRVTEEMLATEASTRLTVTFTSFGHKHGPPRDADLAFDVRFLPNPHYVPKLRPLTGLDREVVEYVGRDGRLEEFLARVTSLLEWLLPQYVAEGKAHLVVAIGCTGGRHRSVAVAEHLAAHFREDPNLFIDVRHRDAAREPAAPPAA